MLDERICEVGPKVAQFSGGSHSDVQAEVYEQFTTLVY